MRTFIALVFSLITVSAIADTQKLVWFGNQEVKNGKLKSANGQLPRTGEQVTLRVFKAELAAKVYDGSGTYMGGQAAMAMAAKLFVRFTSNQDWQSVELKRAYYSSRGPSVDWENYEDVILDLPYDAKKVEVWLEFERARPVDCYLAYDMTECAGLYPWSPGYISNFGKNFELAVAQ